MSSNCKGCHQSQATCSALQSRGKRGRRCCEQCTHKTLPNPFLEEAAVAKAPASFSPDLHQWALTALRFLSVHGESSLGEMSKSLGLGTQRLRHAVSLLIGAGLADRVDDSKTRRIYKAAYRPGQRVLVQQAGVVTRVDGQTAWVDIDGRTEQMRLSALEPDWEPKRSELLRGVEEDRRPRGVTPTKNEENSP